MLDSALLGDLHCNLYRFDRSIKRGGGVCVHAKAFICAQIVTFIYDLKADSFSAEIFCRDNVSLLPFILVYRSQNNFAADDIKLVDILSDMGIANHHTIILGDYNLQVNWVNTKTLNSSSTLFLDFFLDAGLVQNVNLPIHSYRILDIILLPNICTLDVKLLPPLASSDHTVIQFRPPVTMSTLGILMSNFFEAEYSSLNYYFCGVDWAQNEDEWKDSFRVSWIRQELLMVQMEIKLKL
ncbi:hypothetical protein RB195_024105 [Necator americanus]|uniref:Endonuclease/exonuclease/phosphatase domain-containing protein n=1 Tax=Necator americanus TaxID=51031 RepID=A0ABR1ELV3_NECAM